MNKSSPSKALRSEQGQALTEYIALVILVALVCIPIMKLLPIAVRGYVKPFYYCVSRPLP
ncbi:MAG: hypothetical protein U0136_08400 [Bdellovibrionota bacterium]